MSLLETVTQCWTQARTFQNLVLGTCKLPAFSLSATFFLNLLIILPIMVYQIQCFLAGHNILNVRDLASELNIAHTNKSNDSFASSYRIFRSVQGINFQLVLPKLSAS